MPGRRVFDLIEIPDEFWHHADVLETLRRRDIGRLFVLLNGPQGSARPAWPSHVTPPSPRSAATCGGSRRSKNWVFSSGSRTGWTCPTMPVSPSAWPQRASIQSPAMPGELSMPRRNTGWALPGPAVSGLLSADAGDSEEDDPSVRRRTFVGLTGVALFGAILADYERPGRCRRVFRGRPGRVRSGHGRFHAERAAGSAGAGRRRRPSQA